MFDDGELLSEFIEETNEHLVSAQNGLVAIDRQLSHGGIRQATIDQVFRSIHTIKGGAGFLALDELQLLAHRMEELLSRVRDRDFSLTPDHVTVLLEGCDRIELMVERLQTDEVAPPVSDLVSKLQHILDAVNDDSSSVRMRHSKTARFLESYEKILIEDDPASSESEIALSVNESESCRPSEHAYCYQLTYSMKVLEQHETSPVGLIGQLTPFGTVIDTRIDVPLQTFEESGEEDVELKFIVLYASVFDHLLIEHCSSPAPVAVTLIDDPTALEDGAHHLPALQEDSRVTTEAEALRPQAPQPPAVPQTTDMSIDPRQFTIVLPNGATVYCPAQCDHQQLGQILELLRQAS